MAALLHIYAWNKSATHAGHTDLSTDATFNILIELAGEDYSL